MNGARISLFFAILGLVFAWTGQVWASESLSAREKLMIESYGQQTLHVSLQNLQITPADLNEDGLNEYIVRTGCPAQNAPCAYKILAEQGNKIIELGDIDAFNVILGSSYSQGVRNIIAFKDSVNDYDRAVYVWEPLASRYIIKK